MVSYIRAPEKEDKGEKGNRGKGKKRKKRKNTKETKTNITCAQGAGRVPKGQGYGCCLLVCMYDQSHDLYVQLMDQEKDGTMWAHTRYH